MLEQDNRTKNLKNQDSEKNYFFERLSLLEDINSRLILLIYILAVLAHLPGEITAPFFLSYSIGWRVIAFQTVMVLSDGIGVILIYLAISLVRNDILWIKRKDQIVNFLMVMGLGFVVATVTETFGAHILNLWSYSAYIHTLFGVAAGAILGWTVLPVAVFLIINREYSINSIAMALAIIAGANVFGALFLV